jgi:serine/threonine protein kinase
MVTAELGACEWFVYELRRSNLIDRGQLEQIVGDFLKHNPRADAAALAQNLVDQNVLSQFQADRVLSNKAQGLVLGPYVLVDALGAGSMGTVYKALSKTDQQFYAVKVLPRRSMWNVRLARRQVRQFGQFSHAAVAPFVDVGTSGGMHYLVWPLVDGDTLESLVQGQGKLSSEQTAQVGWQIANALNICHQNGIFHGLLKPSNVMIGAHNRVTVLDFGIGSLLAENEGESLVDTMSTANTLTSGLDCCSPESILEPTNRTPAGDQYSLGCTLYYCLTGRYPFSEGSAVEKMMAHQFKDPESLKDVVPDVPAKLAAVVERLMKKKPEERYRGLDEVVDELHPLAGDVSQTDTVAATNKPQSKMAMSSMRDRTARRAQAASNGSVSPPASPYPQPAVYPSSTSSANHRPLRGAAPAPEPSVAQAERKRPIPSRKQLQADTPEAQADGGYNMPPGFVEERPSTQRMSPVFYTVLGMCVMAVTYMALMFFKPFG